MNIFHFIANFSSGDLDGDLTSSDSTFFTFGGLGSNGLSGFGSDLVACNSIDEACSLSLASSG